jgi:hypothetical protein
MTQRPPSPSQLYRDGDEETRARIMAATKGWCLFVTVFVVISACLILAGHARTLIF